jgi:signal transduction histidine kinase
MAAETPPENRCSVLIVDDEEGPRQALEFVLRPHFRVLAASSGEEAIEILRRERVDVVTLDLSMPGIDGLATLTRIREIIPEMAVVIVTAKGTLDNAKEAVRLRAFDFIQKPFSAATVLEVINKAGESASTRSAFLTNMGHELRTSLTVLVGYSSMVAEQAAERSGGANLPAVDAMERASGRLMSTVRSVIDLSMIEAGSFTIEPVSVDMAALVEKETGELTRLAQKKNLSLRLEIAERGGCVRFDAYCLANAFRAILDNAIKFTREGGVVVKLHRDERARLCIEVQDTGVGIGKDHFPRLFRKFYQEHTGTSRQFEGLGIGLALAKQLVERNGASLSFESEKGRGSTFRIHLPPTLELAGEASTAGSRAP